MVESSVVPQKEEKKKSGLQVLGYVVPWVVVVLVLVVLLVMVYGERLKASFQTAVCPSVISASLASATSVPGTPAGLKQFFRR
jgi:hypothetical protein